MRPNNRITTGNLRMHSNIRIRIHHGGSFVQHPVMNYENGEVEEVTMDLDYLSYPHLLKYIKENRYGKIHSLSYKLPHERMENLRLLNNDRSTVDLMHFACVWGQVDIFVEHGLDDAEVVPELALPESVTQLESEKAATGKQGDEEQLLGDDLEGEEGDEEQFLGDDLEGEEAENRDEDDDLMDVECHTASSSDDENREARRVEVEAENIGGNVNEEVDSEYYDSEDPPSYQSEHEEEEASFQQSKKATSKFKNPSYNPNVELVELELGTLYDDGKQFKKAMINYAVYSKRNIHFVKNEPKRVSVACEKPCPFQATGS
ncbi:uncharacterized protein LOC115999604 [Ipomoea triloba]|uniref:uncharacterized protein LOC115999604 n=1 Tax=Ipomoea triloba TaxID=35885 RepID=UPI00125DCAAD|nr:uncharacterized protein LOC115999604 [Ipomoea triloba]